MREKYLGTINSRVNSIEIPQSLIETLKISMPMKMVLYMGDITLTFKMIHQKTTQINSVVCHQILMTTIISKDQTDSI